MIFNFSSKSTKRSLSTDFIDFFRDYLKNNDSSEDSDLNTRFYITILQSYTEFLHNKEQTLSQVWIKEMKPYLLDKYPFQKCGIFNMNADVEFLVKEIDKILNPEKPKDLIIQKRGVRGATIYVSASNVKKAKEKINSVNSANSNDNTNTNTNTNKDSTIPPHKKNKFNRFVSMANIGFEVVDQLNSIQENNAQPSPLQEGILEIENEMENNVPKNNNNENSSNNLISDFENTEIKVLKRINSSTQIRSHSFSINSKSTFYTSDLDFNDLKKNKTLNCDDILNGKEILPTYLDEFETENVTIGHNKDKQLKMISLNLLLKKIITSNFMENSFDNVNNFVQQCFSFIDVDILFSKIINCYSYYQQLNLPFNQIKNLIQFTNGLIVEMYNYYQSQKIALKITSIKKFYNDLQNELRAKIKTEAEKNKSLKIKQNIQSENSKNEQNETKNLGMQYEEILNEIQYINLLLESTSPNAIFIRSIKSNLYYYKIYKKNTVEKNKNEKNNNDSNTKSRKNKSLEKRHHRVISELRPLNPIMECGDYFSLKNYSPLIVGEKLRAITINNLNKIQYKELYKAVFLKKTKSQMCPNVMNSIKYFNNLISFIIEDILSYDLAKNRADIISEWLNVSKYCKSRNDYSDCIAIYSALNHYLINGLTQTWKELKNSAKTIFKDLSHLCSCGANYKHLREEMNNLDSQEFYTPYLGMLMRDISFNEESMKYLINGNLINIEKMEYIRNLIDNFFRYKKNIDCFKINRVAPKELDFFDNLEPIEEQYLENIANALEPKFTLDLVPRREKRYTEIDKKYYGAKKDGVLDKKTIVRINRRSVI